MDKNKRPTYTIGFIDGKRLFSYKKKKYVEYFYDADNNQYHPIPNTHKSFCDPINEFLEKKINEGFQNYKEK